MRVAPTADRPVASPYLAHRIELAPSSCLEEDLHQLLAKFLVLDPQVLAQGSATGTPRAKSLPCEQSNHQFRNNVKSKTAQNLGNEKSKFDNIPSLRRSLRRHRV